VDGLALALSLSTCGQLLAYLLLLGRISTERLELVALVAPLGRIALAVIPSAAVGWAVCLLGAWEQGPGIRNGLVFAAAGVAGGAAYTAAAWALGIQEVRQVAARIRSKLGR